MAQAHTIRNKNSPSKRNANLFSTNVTHIIATLIDTLSHIRSLRWWDFEIHVIQKHQTKKKWLQNVMVQWWDYIHSSGRSNTALMAVTQICLSSFVRAINVHDLPLRVCFRVIINFFFL